MNPTYPTTWLTSWMVGLPLVVLTVVIHVVGLGLMNEKVVRMLSRYGGRRFAAVFVVIVGTTALLAAGLHGVEAVIWGGAYLLVGALPDARSAMLFSLNAITTYGHENLHLEGRWTLLGSLEALNGMILFGLTTAFLYQMIHAVWPLGSRGLRGKPPGVRQEATPPRATHSGNAVRRQ